MIKNKPSTAIIKATEEAAMIELTAANVVNYINKNASKEEVALFLNQCSMFQLNPFKREIYLIKYDPKDKATFVVGYESYLKRADRTGRWNGMETGTIDDPKTGKVVKAWAKICRKDWTAPLYHEVYFEEYAQYHTDYKSGETVLTKFWRDKPRTMLKKVALAQALRLAFPDELGGMPYTIEEMPIELSAVPHTIMPAAGEIIEVKPGGPAEPLAEQKKEAEKETLPTPATEPKPTAKPTPDPNLAAKKLVVEKIKAMLAEKTFDPKQFKIFLYDFAKNHRVKFVERNQFKNLSFHEGDYNDLCKLVVKFEWLSAKYLEWAKLYKPEAKEPEEGVENGGPEEGEPPF